MATLSALGSLGWGVRRAPGPQSGAASSEPARPLLRVDTAFFHICGATGGDFYFWSPGEFGRSPLEIPLGGEDILLFHAEIAGERRFSFPVDTLLSRVDVFVGAQELELTRLAGPDGLEVAARPGVRVQEFEHMRLVTLEHPAAGAWTLDVRGRGLACVTVRGGTLRGALPPESDLEPILLVDFAFVAIGGRPGHEGWFPLERPALPGEHLTARVVLGGSFATAELGFVRGDDMPCDVPCVPLGLEPGSDTAYAQVVVPREPYRVVVRGFDVSGSPFRRLDGPLHESTDRP